jgi:hypothetical protein
MLHTAILSSSQKKALKVLGPFVNPRSFYLGGGTAVALHLGHRLSVDLDWFTPVEISDPAGLAADLKKGISNVVIDRVEKRTVHCRVAGVSVTFMDYRYPMLSPSMALEKSGCSIASLDDLACMKLSAMAQRGSKKDFVDLYAICLKHRTLPELLGLYKRKYSIKDMSHVLIGLSYMGDAEREKIPEMKWKAGWGEIKKAFRGWVRELANSGRV